MNFTSIVLMEFGNQTQIVLRRRVLGNDNMAVRNKNNGNYSGFKEMEIR